MGHVPIPNPSDIGERGVYTAVDIRPSLEEIMDPSDTTPPVAVGAAEAGSSAVAPAASSSGGVAEAVAEGETTAVSGTSAPAAVASSPASGSEPIADAVATPGGTASSVPVGMSPAHGGDVAGAGVAAAVPGEAVMGEGLGVGKGSHGVGAAAAESPKPKKDEHADKHADLKKNAMKAVKMAYRYINGIDIHLGRRRFVAPDAPMVCSDLRLRIYFFSCRYVCTA